MTDFETQKNQRLDEVILAVQSAIDRFGPQRFAEALCFVNEQADQHGGPDMAALRLQQGAITTLKALRTTLQCAPGENLVERAERVMGTITAMTSGMLSAPVVADDVAAHQVRHDGTHAPASEEALRRRHSDAESFLAGEPTPDHDMAWLLLRRDGIEGENAQLDVVLAVSCQDGDLNRWAVSADWKAESVLDAIDHEGPCEIVGWLPYHVPAPSTKVRLQLESAHHRPSAEKHSGGDTGQVWGWAIVDVEGRAKFTRPFRAFLGATAINTRAFTVEDVLSVDRSSPSGAPHHMLTLTAIENGPSQTCTGAGDRHHTYEDLAAVAARYWAINTPEIEDFLKGVHNEALHQRERWHANGDAGKTDADWFWLVGHLGGKAIHATDRSKKLHHIVTTAATLLNWHAASVGAFREMRPGIAPPATDAGGPS